MKYLFIILYIIINNFTFGQNALFKKANHWKLYDITTGNLFQYSIDTLKNFPYQNLSDDSMHLYLNELSELPSDDLPRWMGAHIATYELDGKIQKIEISLYGGFFYDEISKRHYQLPENKTDEWLSYIRRSFMAIHKVLAMQ